MQVKAKYFEYKYKNKLVFYSKYAFSPENEKPTRFISP